MSADGVVRLSRSLTIPLPHAARIEREPKSPMDNKCAKQSQFSAWGDGVWIVTAENAKQSQFQGRICRRRGPRRRIAGCRYGTMGGIGTICVFFGWFG